MSLVIVLSVKGKAPIWNENTSISFDGSDADYWYLWPTMIKEIKDETGQLIDLYDGAEFGDNDLVKVERITLKHLAALKQKEEKAWDVCIGTQLGQVNRDIFATLIKDELEIKLDRFLLMLRLAMEKNEKIICIGD